MITEKLFGFRKERSCVTNLLCYVATLQCQIPFSFLPLWDNVYISLQSFNRPHYYLILFLVIRCRKLPKGLKEWPAFNTLKKTIDDFNDMCPLLELMSNKAMKPRHWQRIAEVISRPLEVDNENFCLRNIMDTPLLQFKEDIEVSNRIRYIVRLVHHDICLS